MQNTINIEPSVHVSSEMQLVSMEQPSFIVSLNDKWQLKFNNSLFLRLPLIHRSVQLLIDRCKLRLILFLTPQPIELLEAHDKRPPFIRIDPILETFQPQLIIHVGSQDPHLERQDLASHRSWSHTLMRSVEFCLHLYGTLKNSWWVDKFGALRCHAGCCELVFYETVPASLFGEWNVGCPGGEGQAIDMLGLVVGWEVEHALFRTEQVHGRL